jgi:NADPH:quinone reductase-like Zn-dependent oxidoreductase
VEYGQVGGSGRRFGTIVDTVGGEPLRQCWGLVAEKGSIVTVDSGSFEFGEKDAPPGKEGVRAKFFILEPSGKHLERIARGLEQGALKAHVAYTFPLGEARAAYEKASGRLDRRGKVVLTI